MKLKVVPPDVNASDYYFTARAGDTIVYGLGAIKGVGQSAIEGMLQERGGNGVFSDLYDLCRRVDLRKVNRRVFEALIRAGALDSLGDNRATQMANLPLAMKLAEQNSRNQDTGQDDLFGETTERSCSPQAKPSVPEWDEEQKLLGEKETLGLYLTGHPIIRYQDELERIISGTLASLVGSAGDNPCHARGGLRAGSGRSS
jgi:DNA polymerase-3 subunit alpha